MVMDADGKNRREVTHNGKANFGPAFTPDGKKIIFASNLDDSTGRSFDLYLVALDGPGLERVTTFTNEKHDDFDGFPMFSPDGKTLVWCSNRFNDRPHETNVFMADWVE
jgi:Tol biopolymer transport system component